MYMNKEKRRLLASLTLTLTVTSKKSGQMGGSEAELGTEADLLWWESSYTRDAINWLLAVDDGEAARSLRSGLTNHPDIVQPLVARMGLYGVNTQELTA